MKPTLTEGPSKIYRPVCIRYKQGFRGGPICYHEVPIQDAGRGPIIIELKNTEEAK